MIGVTISDAAYAAIAFTLPPGHIVEQVDGHCKIWLPQDVVNGLRAQRAPGESFSDTILRLAERGSLAALTR